MYTSHREKNLILCEKHMSKTKQTHVKATLRIRFSVTLNCILTLVEDSINSCNINGLYCEHIVH